MQSPLVFLAVSAKILVYTFLRCHRFSEEDIVKVNDRACLLYTSGKLFPNKNKSMSREEYMSMLVTIIVLFCASGTGIYGALDSGMSGDHTILISKSILDFFTAMIFGGTLGMVIAAVAIPQCVIFLIIFAAAKFIFPLTTPCLLYTSNNTS